MLSRRSRAVGRLLARKLSQKKPRREPREPSSYAGRKPTADDRRRRPSPPPRRRATPVERLFRCGRRRGTSASGWSRLRRRREAADDPDVESRLPLEIKVEGIPGIYSKMSRKVVVDGNGTTLEESASYKKIGVLRSSAAIFARIGIYHARPVVSFSAAVLNPSFTDTASVESLFEVFEPTWRPRPRARSSDNSDSDEAPPARRHDAVSDLALFDAIATAAERSRSSSRR